MEIETVIEIATGAEKISGDTIVSNVTGRKSTLDYGFFKDGVGYLSIIDSMGTRRNVYAKVYGMRVKAINTHYIH